MLQIVNDDNNDTKGVLVKSLSITTTSFMALCALYVSSAKYLLNKLFIPNRLFSTAVQFAKITLLLFFTCFLLSYNVSAKCKLTESNLLNSILLLCNSDNKNQKQTRCGQQAQSICRDDYGGLTSDIFQAILLNVRPLIHHFHNAMYGCLIKLGTNVAINGFCPIISENL